MVISEFQEDLMEDIRNTLQHMTFQTPDGRMSKINVFAQALPYRDATTDEEDDPYPYVIVRVSTGKSIESAGEKSVQVILLIGIINREKSNQGHKEVLNVINDIEERFERDRILAQKYVAKDTIEWALQDEETYPYFFGGMEMEFYVPAIRKELRQYT